MRSRRRNPRLELALQTRRYSESTAVSRPANKARKARKLPTQSGFAVTNRLKTSADAATTDSTSLRAFKAIAAQPSRSSTFSRHSPTAAESSPVDSLVFVDAFQRLIVPSQLFDASIVPSGLNATRAVNP